MKNKLKEIKSQETVENKVSPHDLPCFQTERSYPDIPTKIIQSVDNARPAKLAILSLLIQKAINFNHNVCLKRSTIEDQTGYSETTVKRELRELRAEGLIETSAYNKFSPNSFKVHPAFFSPAAVKTFRHCIAALNFMAPVFFMFTIKPAEKPISTANEPHIIKKIYKYISVKLIPIYEAPWVKNNIFNYLKEPEKKKIDPQEHQSPKVDAKVLEALKEKDKQMKEKYNLPEPPKQAKPPQSYTIIHPFKKQVQRIQTFRKI